jgi:16S rRNA (guanine527-N7)-methyltransferase
VEAEPDSLARLELYARELASWGSRINLVGSTEPESVRAHIAEALVGARALPRGARVVDLGSGAGLPGVPIAIARPDLEVTLVEIRERRVHFLRHVARVVPAAIRVLRQRIQDPPADMPAFDFALLRAVAPVERSLALGRRWVRPGGEIWVWSRERPAPGGLPDDLELCPALPLESRGQILRIRVVGP